jgi:hypothetical protein
MNILQIIIKAFFPLIVLAELILSSCATSKNLGGDYDDLYYSPSDKQIIQNSDKTKIQSNLPSGQEVKSVSKVSSIQSSEVKVPVRSETTIQNKSNLDSVKIYKQNSLIKNTPLMIKKTDIGEVWRMSKEDEIDPMLQKQLYTDHYLIYTNSRKLYTSEVYSLMASNEDAYKMMMDSQAKVDRIGEINKFGHVYIPLIAAVIIVTPLISDLETDKVVAIDLLVMAPVIPIFISLSTNRHTSFKLAQKAVDLFNMGLKTSWNRPKPKLTFGFTGNGTGMRINF